MYRSLASFDSADTAVAAKIEDNLLQASPADTEIMARIGDIYADRELFTQAAPYWERIPQAAPGQPDGYLEAATIYWDYFDFDNALRLLGKGRDRLANPSLYAYEAGAIYENQRRLPASHRRVCKGRPQCSGIVGGISLAAVSGPTQVPRSCRSEHGQDRDFAAAMHRCLRSIYASEGTGSAGIASRRWKPFLDSLANGTTTIEQAEEISETLAQQKSLEMVRQHALEKQAALTTDPITRLQLRYALIRLYESRKDFPGCRAKRTLEVLYHENPKILGVVRSMLVDFYWRMNRCSRRRSLVLLQAAKDALPSPECTQFTFEAATQIDRRKAISTRA